MAYINATSIAQKYYICSHACGGFFNTSQLLKSRLKMMQIYLHGILNHFSLKHPCHAINKRIIMKYFE